MGGAFEPPFYEGRALRSFGGGKAARRRFIDLKAVCLLYPILSLYVLTLHTGAVGPLKAWHNMA